MSEKRNPKGYYKLPKTYVPVIEKTLVGCRRCRSTWYEDVEHTIGVRINSALLRYDYCDVCITEQEQKDLK